MKRRGRWLMVLYLWVGGVLLLAATLPFLVHLPRLAEYWNEARPASPKREAHVEREVLGQSVLAMMYRATQGWAVLVHDPMGDGPTGPPDADGAHHVGKALIERVPRVPLSPHDLAQWKSQLLSEKSYDFEMTPDIIRAKMCAPVYGARIIFESGNELVSVDFCFDCYILQFTVNGGWPKHADFKSREFARFFRARFPDDKIAAKFD